MEQTQWCSPLGAFSEQTQPCTQYVYIGGGANGAIQIIPRVSGHRAAANAPAAAVPAVVQANKTSLLLTHTPWSIAVSITSRSPPGSVGLNQLTTSLPPAEPGTEAQLQFSSMQGHFTFTYKDKSLSFAVVTFSLGSPCQKSFTSMMCFFQK